MNLSFFDRRDAGQRTEHVVEPDGATLRMVERPAPSWEPRVIEGGASAAAAQYVPARAEIKAKRFVNGRVWEERYEATLHAADGSPSALMTALAEAIAQVPEFHAPGSTDERVVLQISLVR